MLKAVNAGADGLSADDDVDLVIIGHGLAGDGDATHKSQAGFVRADETPGPESSPLQRVYDRIDDAVNELV